MTRSVPTCQGDVSGFPGKRYTSDMAKFDPDPWLPVAVAAYRLGVSSETLRDWVRRGQAPPHNGVGRQLKFRASEVDAWLADHTDPAQVQEGAA